MASNVVHLPRPLQARSSPEPLALFVRVGRNDHREMLELIATGERAIFGFIIEAQYVERHRELMTEARSRNFDLILDPKTQPLGLPGGHTALLATLPWGLERHHNLSDFEGPVGRLKADQIVEMAARNRFTQVLGPTHLLSGPNDPWLRRDIDMMEWTREAVVASGTDLGLIYSLAVPMEVLRKRVERQALITAIADAPCDAIWLKVENFGDDATGEKMAAYIEACRDFHDRGISGGRRPCGRAARARGSRLWCRRRHRPRRDHASTVQSGGVAPTTDTRPRRSDLARLPPSA